MNDSISVSSSYSSSTHSNSNSLNRSMITNSSFMLMSGNSANGVHNQSNSNRNSRLGTIDDYLSLPLHTSPIRRRARSQTIFFGDEINTISEYNKQLIEDLYMLKKQLKEKDDTILKLNDIRNKLESEIQELSASLFEQAYLMVNTARAETAQSEKLLKEANGKIDVLQAEVKALKELVLTSTPSTPNKHLYPQINGNNKSSHSRQSSLNQQSFNNIIVQQNDHLTNNPATSTPSTTISNSKQDKQLLVHSQTLLQPISSINNTKEKSSFFKSHKRAPSHNDIQTQSKSLLDKLFQSSSNKNQDNFNNIANNNHKINNSSFVTEIAEFDPVYFNELNEWKQNPDSNLNNNNFMKRVYNEDILPCLSFNNIKLSEELLTAIESNCVCIEELSNNQQQNEAFSHTCGLSNIQSICQYKIKLSENSEWIYISKLSRNRVISVCDFFTYLRYIKFGLVKSDVHEIYWNIIDLRKKMALSRLGL